MRAGATFKQNQTLKWSLICNLIIILSITDSQSEREWCVQWMEEGENRAKRNGGSANRPADFIFCWLKQKDAATLFFYAWWIILVPIYFSFSLYLIKISFWNIIKFLIQPRVFVTKKGGVLFVLLLLFLHLISKLEAACRLHSHTRTDMQRHAKTCTNEQRHTQTWTVTSHTQENTWKHPEPGMQKA